MKHIKQVLLSIIIFPFAMAALAGVDPSPTLDSLNIQISNAEGIYEGIQPGDIALIKVTSPIEEKDSYILLINGNRIHLSVKGEITSNNETTVTLRSDTLIEGLEFALKLTHADNPNATWNVNLLVRDVERRVFPGFLSFSMSPQIFDELDEQSLLAGTAASAL